MRTTGNLIQAVQVGVIDPIDPHVRVEALLSNDRVIGSNARAPTPTGIATRVTWR